MTNPTWPEGYNRNCPHCSTGPGAEHEDWCPFTKASGREAVNDPGKREAELTGIYEEGRKAFASGTDLADCPYEDGTEEQGAWQGGFVDAMAEIGGWLPHRPGPGEPGHVPMHFSWPAFALLIVALWQFYAQCWGHGIDPIDAAMGWGIVALLAGGRTITKKVLP